MMMEKRSYARRNRPVMRVSLLQAMIGVIALGILASCAKRPVTMPAAAFPTECVVLQGPKESADSVRVAMFDAARPEHAPWARNASERFLFRHLYETLVVIDCLGEIRPGLAQSWEKSRRGRRWTFVLREDARFWDGTRVTARDVARSWRQGGIVPMVEGFGIDSVTVAGDLMLCVHFDRPHREVPRVLAAPACAVAKPSGYSHWPLGSGPYEVSTADQISTVRDKRTITAHPAFGLKGPVIQFVEASEREARDMLGSVIDVMVTGDPTVIEYAAGRPQLATTALPWDRTYVLLSVSRVEDLRLGGKPGTIPRDLSDRLARDAVRGDARGYRPHSWWEELGRCGDRPAESPWSPPVTEGVKSWAPVRRILYDRDDQIARDLAGRIVALAGTDPGASEDAAAVVSAVPGLIGAPSGLIAEGVTASELRSSLWHGGDFAYVVPVPRRTTDSCSEALALMRLAPWLSIPGTDLSEILVPLVDTRRHAIINGGRIGLAVDWFGCILMLNEVSPGR
jgi:hypothetical protein